MAQGPLDGGCRPKAPSMMVAGPRPHKCWLPAQGPLMSAAYGPRPLDGGPRPASGPRPVDGGCAWPPQALDGGQGPQVVAMAREPSVMLSCRRGPSMKVDDSFIRFSRRNRFSRISVKWTGSTVGERIWREEIAGGKGGGVGLAAGTGCCFPPRLAIRFKRTSKTCSAGRDAARM